MTFGSLFAGIGGLDLGLERAGMVCKWQVEREPYCQHVLAKHWPEVERFSDVREFNPSEEQRVDLVCGGYPCQPFSFAGQRRGEADPRHLWPEFLRIIRALRPRYALLENVPGHLSMGFGRVLGDLAESGYDAEWDCIPAAAFGAPHLRYRVFVVAYATGDSGGIQQIRRQRQAAANARNDGAQGALADAAEFRGNAGRFSERTAVQYARAGIAGEDEIRHAVSGRCSPESAQSSGRIFRRRAEAFAGADLQRGGSRGAGNHWEIEPDVGRVAHGIPARVDRLRALGNAVVPQVAEWIGRRIMESEKAVAP